MLDPVIDMLDPVIDWRAVPADAVVADVRWYLDGRDARAVYEAGHVPGAVFVDLETELARPGMAADGRHPLPTPEDFAAAMGRLGIGDTAPVIAYDDTGGGTAGRLVVMLRMLGHPAALADGGLASYPDELESGSPPIRPAAAFTPRPWPEDRLADTEAAAAAGASPDARLLDARAAERFTGEVTIADARPGHIPGATSAPWTEVLDPVTGRFKTPAVLAEHFAALGIDETTDVVASCGSGVSTCANILALERAGLPLPRLYVASYSGWSADPDRPVESG